MNVTDKQKCMLLEYMKKYPDFSTGRLRYSAGNKKKLDDMWIEISNGLNSSACGPKKQPKEWAKTWRDWKSNTLKKVAQFRNYGSGTGGGPPKPLHTTPVEDALLEFLGPDSSGLENIPQGGFSHLTPQYPKCSTSAKKSRKDTTDKILTEQLLTDPSKDLQIVEVNFGDLIDGVDIVTDNIVTEDRTEDDILENENIPAVTFCHQSSGSSKCEGKRIKKQDPVELLAEKIELKKIEIARKKERDEKLMKFKEEEIKLKKEELEIKKRKVKVMEEMFTQCSDILSAINTNIVNLQEEVRNLGATYLP